MKRFHVHVAVKDLDSSIRFYSALFGSDPTVTKSDYAKWMIDDPRINFAISQRGAQTGVNHLGLQVDSDDELKLLRAQAERASPVTASETNVSCCYARGNKYWYTDPQGVAWETYHTLEQVEFFAAEKDEPETTAASAGPGCCGPITATSVSSVQPARSSCC